MGETSKAALVTFLRIVPENIVKQFIKTPQEAKKILKDDTLIPLSDYRGNIPDDASLVIKRYPFIKEFGYLREIGGEMIFKVLIGTSGKKIV